jgi:uncharacterized membrane protein
MILILIHWINAAWQAIFTNVDWMSWNLFLALNPVSPGFFGCLTLMVYLPSPLSNRLYSSGVFGLLMAVSVFPHFPRIFYLIRSITQPWDWKYLIVVILITTALIIGEFWQFRVQHSSFPSRSLGWWMVFLIFIFFLPNAPYVLTDVIHLVEDIRQGYSIWVISLALIPQYVVFHDPRIWSLYFVSNSTGTVLSGATLGDWEQRN